SPSDGRRRDQPREARDPRVCLWRAVFRSAVAAGPQPVGHEPFHRRFEQRDGGGGGGGGRPPPPPRRGPAARRAPRPPPPPRGPAAFCGLAGLKPSYGRISRTGILPLAFSLDHAGPMAWTAEDCAIMLQAMAGHDPSDPASADCPVPDYRAALAGEIKGLRIG